MKKLLHSLILLVLIFSLFTSLNTHAQCSAGEEEVTINLHTDTWGSEITWSLSSPTETLLSGGPYSNGAELDDVQSVCVTVGTELTFTINDSQNDGICIASGEAKYQIIAYDFIFFENCDYGGGESIVFTLESPPDIDAKLTDININNYITQEFTLKGSIYNNGLNNITAIDFNWQIEGESTNSVSFADLNLASNKSQEIEHSTQIAFEDSLVTKKLYVWISNPNGLSDEDNSNDTIIKTVIVLDEWVKKRALIEHFTNASCGPCASQNPTLNALMAEGDNPDKIAHIAYHTSWPGYDPMYNFNNSHGEGNTRVNFYGVSGVPTAVLDGHYYVGSPVGITQNMINSEYSIPGLMKISTEQEIIEDSIFITAELIALVDLSTSSIMAHIALTEDMEYESAPGSNGEKKFENVMRSMITGTEGYSLDQMNAYDTVRISFRKEFDNIIIDDPKILVFVQDNDNKDVLMTYLYNEDFAPPGIKIAPGDGASNIDQSVNVRIEFTDPIRMIDNSEITDLSSIFVFKKDDQNGEDVNASASLDETNTEITIVPESLLEPNQVYFISVNEGVVENYSDISNYTKSASFTTLASVGINETINIQGLNTYPNPCSDQLNVEFNLIEVSSLQVSIYNETGQLIKLIDKGSLVSGNQTINLNLNEIKNGLYFVSFRFDSEIITRKIQILK